MKSDPTVEAGFFAPFDCELDQGRAAPGEASRRLNRLPVPGSHSQVFHVYDWLPRSLAQVGSGFQDHQRLSLSLRPEGDEFVPALASSTGRPVVLNDRSLQSASSWPCSSRADFHLATSARVALAMLVTIVARTSVPRILPRGPTEFALMETGIGFMNSREG